MTEPDPAHPPFGAHLDSLPECRSEQHDTTSNFPHASTSFVEDSIVMPELMTKSLTLELQNPPSSCQTSPQTVAESPEASLLTVLEHPLSQSCTISQRPACLMPVLPLIAQLEQEVHVQAVEKRGNEVEMCQISLNSISVSQQANQNNRQIITNQLASNCQESEVSSSMRVEVSPGRQEENKSELAPSQSPILPPQNVQSQQNWGNAVQVQAERQVQQIAPIQQHLQMPPVEYALNAHQEANVVMVPAQELFNRDAVILEEEPTAPDFDEDHGVIEVINQDRNASNHSAQHNDPKQAELNEMLSQQLHEVIARDQCVEMQIEPLNYRYCDPAPIQEKNVDVPMEIEEMKPIQQENQEEKQEIQQILTEMNHEETHPVSHVPNPVFSHSEDRIFTFGKPITKPEQITPYFKMDGHQEQLQAQNDDSCPWTMSAVIQQEREVTPACIDIPQEMGNANNGSMNVEHDNNFREHPALSQVHEEIISNMVYLPNPVEIEAKIELNVNQNSEEQRVPHIFAQYCQNQQSSLQQIQMANLENSSSQLNSLHRNPYCFVTSPPSYPIKREGNIDNEFELERQPQANNMNQSEFSEDSNPRKFICYAKKIQQTLEDGNDSNIQPTAFFRQGQIQHQPSLHQAQPPDQSSYGNQAEVALVNMVFEQEQSGVNIDAKPNPSKIQVKNNGSNKKEKFEDHINSVQIIDMREPTEQEQRVLREETSIQYHMAERQVEQDPPADVSQDHLAIHNSPIDLISQPEASQMHSLPNIQHLPNGNQEGNVQQPQTEPEPQHQPAFNPLPQFWGMPTIQSFIPAYIPFNANPCQYFQPQLMQPQQQFVPQFVSPMPSYLPNYHSGHLPSISISINRMNEISLNMFPNGNQQFIQPQIPNNYVPSQHQKAEIPQAPQVPPPPVVQRPQQPQNQPQERVQSQREVLVKKDASTQACLPLPEVESSSDRDRDRSNQREIQRDSRFRTKIEARHNTEHQEEADSKQTVEFEIGLCADQYLLNQHPSDQDHRDFQQQLQPYINLKFTPQPRNECGEHLFKNGLIMLAMVKLIVRSSPTPFILNHIYEYINTTFQVNKNRFGFIQEVVRAKEVYQEYLDKQYLERYAKKRDEIHQEEEVIRRRVLNIAPQVAISELLTNIQSHPAVVQRGRSMNIDSNSFSINERVCAIRQQPAKEISNERLKNQLQFDIKVPSADRVEGEQRKPAPFKYQLSRAEETSNSSPNVNKDKNQAAQKGVDKVVDKGSTTNTQKDDILIKLSEKLLKIEDVKPKEKQAKTQEKPISSFVIPLSERKEVPKKNDEGEGENTKYLDLFQKYKKIRQIKKIDPKAAKTIDVEEKKNPTQGDMRNEIKPEEPADRRNKRVQFLEEPASREKDDEITNEEDEEDNNRKKKKGKSKGKPKRDTSAEDSEQEEPIPRDNRRKKSQSKK